MNTRIRKCAILLLATVTLAFSQAAWSLGLGDARVWDSRRSVPSRRRSVVYSSGALGRPPLQRQIKAMKLHLVTPILNTLPGTK